MKKATNSPESEWFRDWFDCNYELVYNHRTDTEAERFVSRWPLNWSDFAGTQALDIGCGNGRFCRAIGRRGLKAIGIDLSLDQLSLARKGCIDNSSSFVRADMRQLPLRGRFSLVASLFTSFGYFETDQQNREVLDNLTQLLLPSGTIILDLPNRQFTVNRVKAKPVTSRQSEGVTIVEERRLTEGNSRVEKEITITSSGKTSHYRESIRIFSADELLEMTSEAGLTNVVPLWGDYSGSILSDFRPRMVYFGRKNG